MREKIKNMEELDKLSLIYGVVDETLEVEGVPVWVYAVYNEYGTETKDKKVKIPSRPFFRSFQWNKKDLAQRYVKWWITHCINGNVKPVDAFKKIGRYFKTSIEESLLEGAWAPNHPTTIKYKSGERPLYDTGNLLNAIGFVIYKGDTEIYREVGR